MRRKERNLRENDEKLKVLEVDGYGGFRERRREFRERRGEGLKKMNGYRVKRA